MAVDKTWINALANNDYATADNWSPSGVPVSTDTVILNETSSAPILTGLNQAAVNLANLYVQRGYAGGQVGQDSSNPLKIAVSGVCVIEGGIGTKVYLDAGGTNPIAACIVDMKQVDGECQLCGGTFTKTLLKRGAVTLKAGTFTTVFTSGDLVDPSQLSLRVLAANVTNLYGLAGNGLVDSVSAIITNLWWDMSDLTVSRGAVSNINVRYPGRVIYNTPDGGAGPALELFPRAVFDASGDARAKTIASAVVHDTAQLLAANSANNITFTTGPKSPTGFALAKYIGD